MLGAILLMPTTPIRGEIGLPSCLASRNRAVYCHLALKTTCSSCTSSGMFPSLLSAPTLTCGNRHRLSTDVHSSWPIAFVAHKAFYDSAHRAKRSPLRSRQVEQDYRGRTGAEAVASHSLVGLGYSTTMVGLRHHEIHRLYGCQNWRTSGADDTQPMTVRAFR